MAELVLKNEFGRVLFTTVRALGLRSILEIGSFDGDGSTQVFISALRPFRGKRLVCLELRRERHANLRANTKAFSWVEAHCAPSISWSTFSLRDFDQDIWPHYGGADPETYKMVRRWWEEDTALIRSAAGEGFLESSAEGFDGVFIDGGEFSGFDEFRLLRARTKCFMLDDVFGAFKNRRVFQELEKDRNWILLYANQTDRNGTAVFCRRDCMPNKIGFILKKAKAALEYSYTWRFA